MVVFSYFDHRYKGMKVHLSWDVSNKTWIIPYCLKVLTMWELKKLKLNIIISKHQNVMKTFLVHIWCKNERTRVILQTNFFGLKITKQRFGMRLPHFILIIIEQSCCVLHCLTVFECTTYLFFSLVVFFYFNNCVVLYR